MALEFSPAGFLHHMLCPYMGVGVRVHPAAATIKLKVKKMSSGLPAPRPGDSTVAVVI